MEDSLVVILGIVAIVAITVVALVTITALVMYFTKRNIATSWKIKTEKNGSITNDLDIESKNEQKNDRRSPNEPVS